jgi:hypothetical protein
MQTFNIVHNTGYTLLYTAVVVYLTLAALQLPMLWMLKRRLDLLIVLQKSSVNVQNHPYKTSIYQASEAEPTTNSHHHNTVTRISHTGLYTKKQFTVT